MFKADIEGATVLKRIQFNFLILLLIAASMSNISASFSLVSKIKESVGKDKENKSQKTIDLKWVDLKNNTQKTLKNQWNMNLNAELIETSWLGSTYKEVPYTEVEFTNLRNMKINKEMIKLKEDHIQKEKEKSNKVEEEENELLDDFLNAEDDEEEASEDEKKIKAKKEAEENKKYLANFEERKMRRKIMLSLFIPQSRAVLTQAFFVQTKNLDLYCIDIRTGITVWVSHIVGAIESVPFETEKAIYILAGGRAFVLDKRSGFVLYNSLFDRAVYPLLFGRNKDVYAVTYKNKLILWDLVDHYEKWNRRLWDECSEGVVGDENGLLISLRTGSLKFYDLEGNFKWEFLNKAILTDKIYYEKKRNLLIQKIAKEKSEAREEDRRPDISKLKKFTDAVNKAEANISRLGHATRGQYDVRPIIDNGQIFISSTDYNVYSLNRYSGTINWNFNCGSKLRTVPHANSKMVWQLDVKGNLFGIDREKGVQKLKIPSVEKVYGTTNELAYYKDFRGRFIVESESRKSQLTLANNYTPIVNAELKIVLCLDKKNGSIHQYRLVGK